MKHQVLCWHRKPHEQRTPLLFIGKRLCYVNRLKKGATVLGLNDKTTYLVDELWPDMEDGKPTGYQKMFLIPQLYGGKQGMKKTAYTGSSHLAVKTADILPEHQALLYADQQADGKIVSGVFQPHARYLVDWHKRYMNYFMYKRNHAMDFANPAKNELPNLFWRIIEEIGPAVFNDFIRFYFVGKRCHDDTMAAAHKALRQVDPISNCDESKSFAESMLYIALHMGDDFWEATKAVVYKQGVVMDFDERIR